MTAKICPSSRPASRSTWMSAGVVAFGSLATFLAQARFPRQVVHVADPDVASRVPVPGHRGQPLRAEMPLKRACKDGPPAGWSGRPAGYAR